MYTPEEVAGLLKLDVRTIYRYIREGSLFASKFGRVYRVSEPTLREFIDERMAKRSSDPKGKLAMQLDALVATIVARYDPEKIMLFGSLAKGGGRAGDVDLLIVKKTDKNYFERIREFANICPRDIPIDILIYTPAELVAEKDSNPFLRDEVMKKGKVVYERAA
jgi:excisionase family DNA binding protein